MTPGAAASIVVGCLYVYMRNGDSRALVLAQRLLEDLRLIPGLRGLRRVSL